MLLFLGFGVLLGHVARSPPPDALASARGPVKLVLGAAGSASAQVPSSPSSSQSQASSPAAEAPSTEGGAEPTPTPAPAPATTGSGAARTPAKSKGGAGAQSESGGQGGAGGQGGTSEAAGPAKKLPPLKHVFVIMLSDEPYASVFGPSSTAPYLAGTLEHRGELLTRYDAVAHEELAERGSADQRPGADRGNGGELSHLQRNPRHRSGPDEQVLGQRLRVPAHGADAGRSARAKHLSWRAYIGGMDEARRATGPCEHPSSAQPIPRAAQTLRARPPTPHSRTPSCTSTR